MPYTEEREQVPRDLPSNMLDLAGRILAIAALANSAWVRAYERNQSDLYLFGPSTHR